MRWWLSYSSKSGPRGVVIAEGDTHLDALNTVTRKGADPGGDEVVSIQIKETDSAYLLSLPLYQTLTAEQMKRLGARLVPPTTIQQVVDGTYRGPA